MDNFALAFVLILILLSAIPNIIYLIVVAFGPRIDEVKKYWDENPPKKEWWEGEK